MLEINRVYLGDCLEIMKDIETESIDMVVIDPPYGINYQSNMTNKKFPLILNDNNNMRLGAYKQIFQVLKFNTVAAIFCSYKNYAEDLNELKKYFSIKNVIIWFKGGGGYRGFKLQFSYRL